MQNQKEQKKNRPSTKCKQKSTRFIYELSYFAMALAFCTSCMTASAVDADDEDAEQVGTPDYHPPFPSDEADSSSNLSNEQDNDESEEDDNTEESHEEEETNEDSLEEESPNEEEQVEVSPEQDNQACIAGMQCLLTCDLNNLNCRQDCVRNAPLAIRATVSTAGLCIANSGCTSNQCNFNQCFEPLTGCTGTIQDTCTISQQCIENCQNDLSCAIECAEQADHFAKQKLTTWAECLTEEQCTTLNCISCPLQNLCVEETPTSIHSCTELSRCVDQCAGQHQCQNNCLDQATQAVRNDYTNLQACDIANSCNQSNACRINNCSNEMRQCGIEIDEPIPRDINIENCMDLNLCVEACPTRNGSCMAHCESQASHEALSYYHSLISCIQTFQCTTRECLSTYCQDELWICAFH